MAVQISSNSTDREFKDLGADPDGCQWGFSPDGQLKVKAKPGAIIIICASGFRVGIDLPGTNDKWVALVLDSLQKRIVQRRPDIDFIFALKVGGRSLVQMGMRFGMRPPNDSLRFPVVLPVGEPRQYGDSVVMTENNEAMLTLGPWVARDANGVKLGIAWRVDALKRVWLDLVKADWDAAAYPVTVTD